MKQFKLLFAAALALAAVSCVQESVPAGESGVNAIEVFTKMIPEGYYATATVTVPAATQTVYIEYKGADGKKTTVAQAVSPKVQIPEDGKDAEPFGTVALLLKSATPTQASIYYKTQEAQTKASSSEDVVPIVDNLPLSSVAFGEFGKTRYVQMEWAYAWENSEATHWVNTRTYPADVVVYDEEHNHTLRYVFVYTAANGNGVQSEGYVLEDAYEIQDHVAVGYKYNYCKSCGGGCPYCMPWGCMCGCGGFEDEAHTKPILKPNPDFVANGNHEQEAIASGAAQAAPEVPEDVVEVTLPEPLTYVTQDGDYTNYHSSGVVMFDDKWPKMPGDNGDGKFNLDFNDVVVDYDLEAVTVSDDRLASEGWREQVKVVLHVRAIGGDDIWRVGVALENFNTDYVQSVSEYKTLDSWQNEHGKLPAWASNIRFQENSIHYDAVSGTEFTRNTNRPSIEIGQLQAYNGKKWDQAAGKDVYEHKDDHGNITEHVMNPALRLWSGWPAPDMSQYNPELENVKEPYTFAQLSSKNFYNTIPGYVNVDGGLYTYTVIYHMKPRVSMDPAQREAAKQNMIDAAMNTLAQNFFAVKKDYTPIGLKGYEPLDYRTKDNHCYADEYVKNFAKNADNLVEDVTYVAKNGQVWAFKAPVQTRHAWEMTYFGNAYPHYHQWAASNGTEAKDWYKTDLNYTYLSCEW